MAMHIKGKFMKRHITILLSIIASNTFAGITWSSTKSSEDSGLKVHTSREEAHHYYEEQTSNNSEAWPAMGDWPCGEKEDYRAIVQFIDPDLTYKRITYDKPITQEQFNAAYKDLPKTGMQQFIALQVHTPKGRGCIFGGTNQEITYKELCAYASFIGCAKGKIYTDGGVTFVYNPNKTDWWGTQKISSDKSENK